MPVTSLHPGVMALIVPNSVLRPDFTVLVSGSWFVTPTHADNIKARPDNKPICKELRAVIIFRASFWIGFFGFAELSIWFSAPACEKASKDDPAGMKLR
ncbi:hypothetical protein A6U85_32020 [Agrobacterium sp. 13-626]|nr:hypothetical protein A6U85_32020 [Agrobacterium sp. 13-626]OCJ24838.1 hypothetical protein A6U89_30175 [Agrobacterium sp. B133/95]